jgi:hypothetical protein
MAKRRNAKKGRGAAAVTGEAEAIIRRLADDVHLREAVANVLDKVGIGDHTEPEPKPKKRRLGFGKILVLLGLAGGGALAVSQGLRTKLLDLLFGAEEEFEYTPPPAPESTDGEAATTPLSAVSAPDNG